VFAEKLLLSFHSGLSGSEEELAPVTEAGEFKLFIGSLLSLR
jgi:hypothetical protein